MGIRAQDREKLFQPFYKTNDFNSRQQNKESHGLGLSICKKIATHMGGDLICTDYSEGCQMIFKLGAEAAPALNKSQPRQETRQVENLLFK